VLTYPVESPWATLLFALLHNFLSQLGIALRRQLSHYSSVKIPAGTKCGAREYLRLVAKVKRLGQKLDQAKLDGHIGIRTILKEYYIRLPRDKDEIEASLTSTLCNASAFTLTVRS
jgi:hypothetical protein